MKMLKYFLLAHIIASPAFANASGNPAILKPPEGGRYDITPMDFNSTAGSGGDDSAAINAAITFATTSGAGRVFLPTAPSGHYNVCASSVNLPGAHIALDFGGTASGGNSIRVLPGCASPPLQVIYQPTTTVWDSQARVHLHDLTVDGYCLAKYNLYVGSAVGFSSHNVVYRNVATGGSNVYTGSGYEYEFDASNRAENVNDAGHTCYPSAASLPNYNFEINSTDGKFDGIIGVNAQTANFYNESGGNNHFRAAHGWGLSPLVDPSQIDLRPQYTFICNGNCDIQGSIFDSSTIAAVALHALNGGLNSGAIVMGGTLMGISSSNTAFVGVQIDSGLQNVTVALNNLSAAPVAANGVKQLGTADASTTVFGNVGASYVTSLGNIPSSYGYGLAFSNGVLSWTPPTTLNVGGIASQGGVTAINYIQPWYYLPYGDFPIVSITAPPTGGAQATATVNTMLMVNPGAVVSGGSGYVTGNHVSLTTAGGGAIYSVTASAGAVTGLTWFSGALFTVLPTDVVSMAWATSTGSGHGLTTHGAIWSFNANSNFTITASGSGYVTPPVATFAPPSDGSLYGGPQTSTANLSSTLALQGGALSFNGVTGFSGTKTAGSCIMTFSNGFLDTVAGC